MDNKLRKPISDKVYLLYNERGDIVHTHRVVSLRGGKVINDEDGEKRAKDRAKTAGHDLTILRTLIVSGEEYDSASHYRVDVSSKKLVRTTRHPSGLEGRQ